MDHDEHTSLVKELQQGRKMRSLETLASKLDDDRHRHIVHSSSVQDGLSKVQNAQRTPTEKPGGRVPVISVQDEAAAAADRRPATLPPIGQDALGKVGGPSVAAELLRAQKALPPLSRPQTSPACSATMLKQRVARNRASEALGLELRSSQFAIGEIDLVSLAGGQGKIEPRDLARMVEAPKGGLKLSATDTGFHLKLSAGTSESSTAGERLRLLDTDAPLKHNGEVKAIAYSPSGTLAAASQDGLVLVWDLKSPAAARKLIIRMSTSASFVEFSPEGQHLVAADDGFFVTAWDLHAYSELGTVRMDTAVQGLAMRSKLLAVATMQKQVSLISIPAMQELAQLRHDCDVASLSFSPCGAKLACAPAASSNGQANLEAATCVWQVPTDASTSQCLGRISSEDESHVVAFAPSGEYLALGGKRSGAVSFIVVQDNFQTASNFSSRAGTSCLAWAADSMYLAIAGNDGRVQVWVAGSDTVALELAPEQEVCCLCFSPDTTRLATCYNGETTVELHRIEKRAEEQKPAIQINIATSLAVPAVHSPPPSSVGGAEDEEFEEQLLQLKASLSVGFSVDADSKEKLDIPMQKFLGATASTERLELPAGTNGALEHQDEVLTLAFSPDGSGLVAGGEDRCVTQWDVAERETRFKHEVSAVVACVAYSTNGRWIFAGDDSGTVQVWDTHNGESLGSTTCGARATVMAASSRLVAVGDGSETASLFLIPSFKVVARMTLQEGAAISGLTFSPDETMLSGVGGEDQDDGGDQPSQVKSSQKGVKGAVWQVSSKPSSNRQLGCLLSKGALRAVAFAPSGKLLAIGGEECNLSVLTTTNESFTKVAEFPVAAGVRCISWAPNSCFVASAGEDKQITVWDLYNEIVAFQLPAVEDWYCAIAFSSMGRWLAGCSYGMKEVTLLPVKVWVEGANSLPKKAAPKAASSKPGAAAGLMAPDQLQSLKTVGSCSRLMKESQQQPAGGQRNNDADLTFAMKTIPVGMKALEQPATNEVGGTFGTCTKLVGFASDDDGNVLVRRPSNANTVDMDSTGFQIRVERVGGCNPVKSIARKSLFQTDADLGLQRVKIAIGQASERRSLQHKDDVLAFAVSPDGQSIVAGGEDHEVQLWDVEAAQSKVIARLMGPVKALCYCPSGKYFTAADDQAFVTLWDATSYEEVATTAVEGEITAVAMSSQQRLLAVGTTAKKATLFSVPDFEELANFQLDSTVRGLSFSPDGSMLAGGGGTDKTNGLMTKKGEDSEMKTVVWQVSSQAENNRYLGSILFSDIVHAVAFAPSGKYLAVGGEDCHVTMLVVTDDFKKGAALPCPAGVRCLAFSPDSLFLATGGEDMQISVWDLLTEYVVFQLPRVDDWYCSLAFSPKGNYIAAASLGSSSLVCQPVSIWTMEVPEEEEEDSEEEEEEAEDLAELAPPVVVHSETPATVTITLSTESVAAGSKPSLDVPADLQSAKTFGTCKNLVQVEPAADPEGAKPKPQIKGPALVLPADIQSIKSMGSCKNMMKMPEAEK
mmetsp:Transcript_25453/g.55652  ORF Transcript_25453/g.55652 Transcript_25453/m.55652 type:complete len:1509 (+) Transcript_25453:32-4558(+)